MSNTSYIDYYYLNYCSGEDMDTADDYTVAMLDMANSDFRDEYTNSLPKNDQFFLYQDADATIYDARFLEKITFNFPQYKHIIDTISPHDHKKIKETYNAILDYHRRQQATQIVQDHRRHTLKERRPRERIISVFEGSYDERTMNEKDDDSAKVYWEDARVLDDDEQDMVDPAPMDTCDQSEEVDEDSEKDNEDPDYIDKSYQRWLRTSARRPGQSHKSACSGKTKPRASRASLSPCVERPSSPTLDDDDDDNDVPALIPDAASSPELQYIATPIASPTATPHVRNAEPKDKLSEFPVLPSPHAEKKISGAGKSKVGAPGGYSVNSDDLIVASWGSENGRTCRSLSSGGFECSCSHRSATMGDMTRHWLSKRHSDAAFGCKGCGRVYTRDDALKRHMRRSDECARRVRRSG